MSTVRRRIYAAHLTVYRGITEQLEQVEIHAFPTACIAVSLTPSPRESLATTSFSSTDKTGREVVLAYLSCSRRWNAINHRRCFTATTRMGFN
jgi:hypothetical protein